MAESAFDFNQAPSGAGRQFGVLAGALGLKSAKSREPKGMSARDQSALMAQQHSHNMELESHRAGLAQQNAVMSSVVGHVIGEEAAAAGHKRTMQATRLSNKHEMQKDYQQRLFAGSEASANRQHEAEQNIQKIRAGTAVSKDPNVRSFNPSTGAITTTHPNQEPRQFDGVGEPQA